MASATRPTCHFRLLALVDQVIQFGAYMYPCKAHSGVTRIFAPPAAASRTSASKFEVFEAVSPRRE